MAIEYLFNELLRGFCDCHFLFSIPPINRTAKDIAEIHQIAPSLAVGFNQLIEKKQLKKQI